MGLQSKLLSGLYDYGTKQFNFLSVFTLKHFYQFEVCFILSL
jgi:hypothetical protein